VIDYRSEGVVARVMDITHQKGVDIGLDTVGPDQDRIVADCLRYDGQMVELVDTVRPDEYRDAFMRGLSFHQLSLWAGHRNGEAARAELVAAGRAFSRLLEQGEVKVLRLSTVSLEETGPALEKILQQRTVGKQVLSMKRS